MISFASAPGNLFNRLGKLGQILVDVRTAQASLLADLTNTVSGVVAQYNSESDLQAEIGNSYISLLSSVESPCTTVQQLAQDTVNRMVFRDNALLNQNLTQGGTFGSIEEVIRQMGLAGASVLAMTVTAVPQTFPPNGNYFANPNGLTPGNAVVLMSTKRPLDGRTLENTFAETLTFTCTSDSFTGGAAAFNEPYNLTGQGNEPDLFAFDWPLGSNCSTGVSAVDGDTSQGAGNLLKNSNFATFASGVPTSWMVVTGGSIITQSTGIVFTPAGSSVLITGDGATKLQMKQSFPASTLTAQTQYGFNIWLRTGGAGATGTLFAELVDQNGNVVKDNAGALNQASVNLNTLTTAWQAFNLPLRLPTVLPTTISLQLRNGTAVNAGGLVYLGKAAFGLMTQAYVGGPFGMVFGGSVPAALGDYNFTTTTNSRGAAGTLATFQTLLYQLLDPFVAQNEILFPSSATPTISDNLI